ncbi:MAG: hypothetical protein ONB43_16565 [candidate division KSB1 bacterium]|nr:hypothetical protein [candidate division KSB1 bacterium]MDZ7405439.1 hypothetical protein [candidate division KSB1 bacterium]
MFKVRNGESDKRGIWFEHHHTALDNYFVRQTGRPARRTKICAGSFLADIEVPPRLSRASPFTAWNGDI